MIVVILEKLEFDFDLEFNIVELVMLNFFVGFLVRLLSMIVVILEKLEFDFGLEFEYDSDDFGKVGI